MYRGEGVDSKLELASFLQMDIRVAHPFRSLIALFRCTRDNRHMDPATQLARAGKLCRRSTFVVYHLLLSMTIPTALLQTIIKLHKQMVATCRLSARRSLECVRLLLPPRKASRRIQNRSFLRTRHWLPSKENSAGKLYKAYAVCP